MSKIVSNNYMSCKFLYFKYGGFFPKITLIHSYCRFSRENGKTILISYIHTGPYEEGSYKCCDMHQFTGPADLSTYKTKNHIF